MSVLNRESSTPDINVEGPIGAPASRRAGNLWTAEARDDMFNRRERGEPWESICHDYPSRSRHAMQQQYSMMKKQRMMADGTWTNNRRGRKRKVLPSATPSVGPRRESGLETTEDEFQSVTPSDLEPDDPDDMAVDDMDLGTPAPEANGHSGPSQSVLDFRPGRPSGLSRSATDPAPAPRGRGRGRGRATSGYTHADSAHPPLAPKGFTPVNEESKYRHGFPDTTHPPAAKRQKSQAESPSAESITEIKLPLNDTSVYFSRDDVVSFFKKGVDNAERLRKTMDEDSSSREKTFHESTGRANRRVYEAEERLKEMGYRHRSDIRNIEIAHQEKMENLHKGYKEKMEVLKNELAIARGVDPSTIEVAKPPEPAQDPAVESKQVLALVANLEELKVRFETEKELRRSAEAKAASAVQERTAAALQSVAPDFLREFGQLESLVMRLHSEVGDLSPKELTKALTEIHARCGQCASHFKSPSPFGVAQAVIDRGTPPAPSPMLQQQQPPPHHHPVTPAPSVRPESSGHQGYDPRGHASTHLAPMQVAGSPNQPPNNNVKPQVYHGMSHHPGLPTPSEAPFENQPFEQKRPTPVSSIHHLLQQPATVPVPPSLPPQAPSIIKSPPYEPSRSAHVPVPAPMQMHGQQQYQPAGPGHMPSPHDLSPIKKEHEMSNPTAGPGHVRQHSNHWT